MDLYYAVGDQRTWMNIKRAIYPGTLREFFENRFMNVPATSPVP